MSHAESVVKINIDTDALAKELTRLSFPVTIAYLSELLNTDRDTAIDWLVCKVAQFRGISEHTILYEIEVLG